MIDYCAGSGKESLTKDGNGAGSRRICLNQFPPRLQKSLGGAGGRPGGGGGGGAGAPGEPPRPPPPPSQPRVEMGFKTPSPFINQPP